LATRQIGVDMRTGARMGRRQKVESRQKAGEEGSREGRKGEGERERETEEKSR